VPRFYFDVLGKPEAGEAVMAGLVIRKAGLNEKPRPAELRTG
jgi:hypothetical protein